jgi:hypothetical protein
MTDNAQDSQMAATAQIIISKANITGAEVPAYVGVHNWLEAINKGHLTVVPTEVLNELRYQAAYGGTAGQAETVTDPEPKNQDQRSKAR